MNRRKFLSFATLGAVSVPVLAVSSEARESSNEADAPVDENVLSIRAGVKEREKVNTGNVGDIQFFQDKYTEHKKVNISVGRDGNLWVKTQDGAWKRVVTA